MKLAQDDSPTFPLALHLQQTGHTQKRPKILSLVDVVASSYRYMDITKVKIQEGPAVSINLHVVELG